MNTFCEMRLFVAQARAGEETFGVGLDDELEPDEILEVPDPKPQTPTPYTLHPAPYTLHLAPG